MSNSRLFGLVQGGISLHRTLIDIENDERARQAAGALETYLPDAEASGVLGDARLADMADLEAANMFDADGLFIGAYQGRMIFYSGNRPVMTYLKTGGGKGRDLVLPNLAHCRNRSLVIGDYKQGENCYSSFDHRSKTLGIPCVVLDPYNISGRGNICINPMQTLLDIIAQHDLIDDEADEIAHALIRIGPKKADPWPEEGAREWIAALLEYFAYCKPDECHPGGLYRAFNGSREEQERRFKLMQTCGYENIERAAHGYYDIWKDAPKQWAAYKSAANKVLRAFAPGKPLCKATSRNDFDFAMLKRAPHTVYIVTPTKKLSVCATWISLIVSHIIEAVANASGYVQTTLILDEFPQMPSTESISKSYRLYRERLVQPWLIAQSPEALADSWSEAAIREFEGQSGILTMKEIESPRLLKDISFLSGTRSVIVHGHNLGQGKLMQAGRGISEQKRAVLQVEDILELGERKQIVRVSGMKRLLVCDTVPWFAIDPWAGQLNDPRPLHRNPASALKDLLSPKAAHSPDYLD